MKNRGKKMRHTFLIFFFTADIHSQLNLWLFFSFSKYKIELASNAID